MEQAKKKYGIWTGIAMVVGVVIGAGIFLKSSAVMKASGGNIYIAISAWLIGGIIMISSGFCFAVYATKISKYNGLIDYLEVASNRKIAYYAGYFSAMIYYPLTGANIASFGAGYLLSICNVDVNQHAWAVYLLAFLFITFFIALNYLSPFLSNKFQISAMVIKLIPIFIVMVVCIFATLIPSLKGRSIISPFTDDPVKGAAVNFGEAVKITAFAYNGWISATAINGELKNSKKNLPRALVFGTIAIVIFYLLFFIGLNVILTNKEILEHGQESSGWAFYKLMGPVGMSILLVFICISCLGNANAMVLCTSRSLFGLAVRGQGFKPQAVSKLKNDKYTLSPYVFSYILFVFYLIILMLARYPNPNNLDEPLIPFMSYLRSSDEMVCSIIYIFYIPIYLYMFKNFKELHFVKRFIFPVIAIGGSAFMVLCSTGVLDAIISTDHPVDSLYGCLMFLVICIALFIPAEVMYRKRENTKIVQNNL